jgi:hypothetical protein
MGFEYFSLALGMLLATLNAANSTQICPNLPKDETLKFHQKSRFSFFFKNKNFVCVEEALEHFSLFGFSIQEFFTCLFYCQKMAFVCEFQHTRLWKMIFFSMFHTSCGFEILRTCT